MMMFRTLIIAVAALIYISGSSRAQLAQQSPNETDKLIRTSSPSDVPEILNKTKSVALTGINPIGSTRINYQLTLQNLSDKNINAVSIDVLSDGRIRIVSMPQGYYGKTFLRARESRTLPESLTTSPDPGSYDPPVRRGVQIVIESVIFEDGSYEGDLKSAGIFLGALVGSRIEVRRILPLLENALSASDAVSASEVLRKELNSLSYEPDEAEVASLVATLPTLDKGELRISVDAHIHQVRTKLLDELESLERSQSNAREFSTLLASKRQYYSKWLFGLNGVTLSAERH
jgi:hypothetical protein